MPSQHHHECHAVRGRGGVNARPTAEQRQRIGQSLVTRIAQGAASPTAGQARVWLQGQLGSRAAAESLWDGLRVHCLDLGEDGRRVLVRKPRPEAPVPHSPPGQEQDGQ